MIKVENMTMNASAWKRTEVPKESADFAELLQKVQTSSRQSERQRTEKTEQQEATVRIEGTSEEEVVPEEAVKAKELPIPTAISEEEIEEATAALLQGMIAELAVHPIRVTPEPKEQAAVKELPIQATVQVIEAPRVQVPQTGDEAPVELKERLENEQLLRAVIKETIEPAEKKAQATPIGLEAQPTDAETKKPEELVVHEAAAPTAKPIEQSAPKQEIEKIFVKVREPQELVPQLTKSLSEKIDIRQLGVSSYEIELDPIELGKIRVKIDFKPSATAVEMNFASKRTMELVEKHIESITSELTAKAQLPIRIAVSEDPVKEDPMQQGRGQGQREQQRREEQRASEEFMQQMKQSLRERELAV